MTRPTWDSFGSSTSESRGQGPAGFFHIDGLHEPNILGDTHHLVTENHREPLYKLELLRMFRERIRLVTGFGILLLPLFSAFYYYLTPTVAGTVVRINFGLIAVLVALMAITTTLKRLTLARVLSLLGYGVFCLGASLLITSVRETYPAFASNSNALQFTILASYVHILLSILLMPYSVWECMVVVGVVGSSVIWGLYWSSPGKISTGDIAQLFVLVTTGTLVVAISHLQNVLRVRAFNSAFELARQASQMQAESATDALTGGFNRRHAEGLLTTELTRSARFGHPLSLIMFDLDNFKPVNDTLGHGAGDEVLKEIHKTALSTLREVDTLGRFGGDEFLVILPETDEVAARTLAQRVRNATKQALRDRFGANSRQARVTLSMGILTISGQTYEVSAALARVDELLYEAKRGGKNQVATSWNPARQEFTSSREIRTGAS